MRGAGRSPGAARARLGRGSGAARAQYGRSTGAVRAERPQVRALAVHNTSCNTTRPACALAADHTKTTRHHRRNQDTSSPRLCKGQAMARGGGRRSHVSAVSGGCAVCARVPYAVPLPVSCVCSLCVVTVYNMRGTTRRRSEDARCDYLHVLHVLYALNKMKIHARDRHIPSMASS